MAGVALGDIDAHFACVALTALGRLWWRTGFPNDPVDAAALCVTGVALGDIHLHFVWQAWHLTTSIVTLRGRRGTYGTGLALVARLVPSGGVVAICRLAVYRRSATGGDFLDFVTVRGCP